MERNKPKGEVLFTSHHLVEGRFSPGLFITSKASYTLLSGVIWVEASALL